MFSKKVSVLQKNDSGKGWTDNKNKSNRRKSR